MSKRQRQSIPLAKQDGLLRFARNDERKKAGIAPGLLLFTPVMPAKAGIQ
jgi:hypothetical protein